MPELLIGGREYRKGKRKEEALRASSFSGFSMQVRHLPSSRHSHVVRECDGLPDAVRTVRLEGAHKCE